jgi:hypothetical protein
MRLFMRAGPYTRTLRLCRRFKPVKKCARRIFPLAIQSISRPPMGAVRAFLWAATDSSAGAHEISEVASRARGCKKN